MINPIVKGSELSLEIESLAFGGKGVARKDNFVVFVKILYPDKKYVCWYIESIEVMQKLDHWKS